MHSPSDILDVTGAHGGGDTARWILAITALSGALVQSVDDITSNGMRWTHWTAIERVIDGPLFSVAGKDFTLRDIVTPMFLVSILYVAWRYIAEQNQHKNAIEPTQQQMQAASVSYSFPPAKQCWTDSVNHA